MKKATILIFLITFQSLILLQAQEIDIETARKVAANFLSGQISKDAAGIVFKNEYTEARNDSIYFYVFAKEENKGYVIVSACDLVKPIISYSLDSTYRHEDRPPGYNRWIESYIENIQKKREEHQAIKQEWEKYKKDY